jgi:hypothetical protein
MGQLYLYHPEPSVIMMMGDETLIELEPRGHVEHVKGFM